MQLLTSKSLIFIFVQNIEIKFILIRAISVDLEGPDRLSVGTAPAVTDISFCMSDFGLQLRISKTSLLYAALNLVFGSYFWV